MANPVAKPRVIADERLDLPDFNAVADLLSAASGQWLANLQGVAEGVLSSCEWTYNNVNPTHQYIELGAVQLYGAKPDAALSSLADATVVQFDPADPIQAAIAPPNIAGFSGSTCVLWWSAVLVQADTKTRRVWSSGGSDSGDPVPVETRWFPRVVWAVTANFSTPPSGTGPWYRLAAVDFQTATPLVCFCHAFDIGFESHALAVAQSAESYTNWPGQIAIRQASTVSEAGRTWGASEIASLLSHIVLLILDNRATFNPQTLQFTSTGFDGLLQVPERGLVQVNDDLDTVIASPALNAPCCHYVGEVTYNSGPQTYTLVSTYDSGIFTVGCSTDTWNYGSGTTKKAVLTASPSTGYTVAWLEAMQYSSAYPLPASAQPPLTVVSRSPLLLGAGAWDVGHIALGAGDPNDWLGTVSSFQIRLFGQPV